MNIPENPSAVTSDYVTVLTVEGRGNKLVKRNKDGSVKKLAGPPISDARALTYRVKNPKAMRRLLRKLAEKPNYVLILGYVPGTEPGADKNAGERYRLVSKKKMGEALGVDPETPDGLEAVLGRHEIDDERCICRLKANMAPSSWCLFDIDAVRGMPDKLADMSNDERREALSDIIPGFAEAGMVIVPSTTGRVLVDGEPMDATGEHYYIQIKDPADLGRFGAVLSQRTMLAGFGFMKPNFSKKEPDKIVGYTPWGIVDPTTFSHERLVYDGSPMVNGDGLAIAEPKIEMIEGERLDTHMLLDLTRDEAATYAARTGQTLRKERRTESVLDADGDLVERRTFGLSNVDERQLKMDTEIVTQSAGVMTLEAYWKGDQGKLRTQTPFRDSSSWNGILNRHKDGTPFIYDNGLRTRYVLPDDMIRKYRADIYMARLGAHPPDQVKKVWTDGLRHMDDHEQDQVRQRVHTLTTVALNELKAQLRSAKERWKKEDIKTANDILNIDIKDRGRTAIKLDTIDIDEVVRRVESVLFDDHRGDYVMSHGGRLVSVRMAKPTTVREVRRERDASTDEVPLSMIVDPYQQYELIARLSKSITFIKERDGAWFEVQPPNPVIRAMLEHSHKRAPSLVGIIEHPVMDENGGLLITDGRSDDGLFIQISRDLVPDLPDEITQEMAEQSLEWITDVALAEFPFASDIDKAGAVAALLTAVQRRMFVSDEGCPGFLTTAPIQSSGKTAFFQLLFALVWGRVAAATNWSSSNEELGKHILAILLEGHSGVLFDNLEEGGRIESIALAQAMTSPKFTGRILGENQQATVPTNCLWCFTGNNISASGDFNTRILPIKIDPGVENPDQRTFSRPDLAEWCEDHRADFYQHVMTILVGYQRHILDDVGDAPDVKPTRYAKWDDQVRFAMIWAGSADPAALFQQNKAEDPKRDGRSNFLAACYAIFGDDPMLLSDVVGYSPSYFASDDDGGDDQELHDAILELLPKNAINSRNLSTVIRKFAGQWIDGYRIVREQVDTKSHKSKTWHIERQQE
jgi:hypothetical protein